MNAKIKSSFNKFEKNRHNLVNSMKQYPADVLGKKPNAGAWSALQVLDHLIEAEVNSITYVEKKVKEGAVGKTAGLNEAYKMLILHGAFILPLKFKAPKNLEAEPKNLPLEQAAANWDAVRDRIVTLLEKAPDADLKKALWKHPRAGKLSLYQMITFLNMHLERHVKQVNRTIAAVK